MRNNKQRHVLLVTGLSGAGLSTVLKSLEDLGYKAVDNLPLSLVDPLLEHKEGRGKPLAIGIDCRTFGFTGKALLKKHQQLKADKSLAAQLLFIDCNDAILQQRFTETRRVHPMAVDRPVADGVLLERQMMADIKNAADLVIDTTDLKAQELRQIVTGHFHLEDDRGLLAFVTSFGFKNGVPREADLVFDVRFLDNPHWYPKLRPLTGLDAPVAEKVGSDPDYRIFFDKLTDLLDTLLPRYDREGKNYLTIAIGCTGGKHRSVFTADQLYRWLQAKGHSAAVRHRDLERAGVQMQLAATERTKEKRKRKKA